ncbi:hypothetical protein SteCoe_3811 [Stentor coeruleus]|uniref:EF-hand domain-containing protein n=1 Tax=Stentor coeruleus TaxID=5963 RepID=A0A1R2CW44_9CILI|nr:hypothetical protein SteCoe_3811 [Stentor coeruleus]
MGCSICISSNRSVEERVLIPVEQSLGLSVFSSVEIDRTLHRYSTLSKMSELQLKKACKNLGLDYKKMENFFLRFSDGESIKVKRLNCVGILLGQGTEKKKISLLFKNYDLDASLTLDCSEIETLIEDVLMVSCKIIPGYAIFLDPGDKELIDYSSKISQVERGLINYFTNIILENRDHVTEEEFCKAFKIDMIRLIITSSEMRLHAYDTFNRIEKPAKFIIEKIKAEKKEHQSEYIERKKNKKTRRNLSYS